MAFDLRLLTCAISCPGSVIMSREVTALVGSSCLYEAAGGGNTRLLGFIQERVQPASLSQEHPLCRAPSAVQSRAVHVSPFP